MKKNYYYNLFYQILTLLIPCITAPYISRVLGPDGVGIYSYTNSIVTYFVLVSALGTSSYGQKETAQNRMDRKRLSEIFWGIELVSIISALMCLSVWMIMVLFTRNNQKIYLVLSITILAAMLDITWFYRGLENFRLIVVYNSVIKIMGLLLVFIFVRSKEDLIIYILIISCTAMLGNLSLWINLFKYIEKVNFINIRISYHLKQTLVYFIPTIAVSVYTVFDKTMLGMLSDNSYENGYYEQANKVISMAKTIPLSLNNVMASAMALLFAQNKWNEVRNCLEKAIKYVLLTGIPIAAGICAVSSDFVPLFFGQGYEKVVGLLNLSAPLILIVGLSNCLGTLYYTPSGQRRRSNKVICFGAFLNILLNMILIPQLASAGAILSTVIAESVITILYIWGGRKIFSVRDTAIAGHKKIFAAVIMYFGVRQLAKHLQPSIPGLCIEILAGAAVYFGLLILLGDKNILEISKGRKKY